MKIFPIFLKLLLIKSQETDPDGPETDFPEDEECREKFPVRLFSDYTTHASHNFWLKKLFIF